MKRNAGKQNLGIWIAAAAFLAAAILLLSVHVTRVTVTGSKRYTDKQMEELLFPGKWDKNSAYLYISNRFKPHRQIPFVEDYKLVFHGPTKVEIIVYEKDIVGYVTDMSSYMYFDKDGIIVESSGNKLEGVPLITGLDFGQLILHRPLPVKDQTVFQDILNLTQQLSLHNIIVGRIEYNSHNKATLYMGEMQVSLGDDANVDSKISVLSDILAAHPQLVGMKGVIELENYNEEGIGGGITFKKK